MSAKSTIPPVYRPTSRAKQEAKPLIPEKYQDYIYIGLLIVSVLIFLSPAIFGGGSFNSSDNIASASFRTFIDQSKASGDPVPLWLPYIFSGMPSFAALLTTGDRWWDLVAKTYISVTQTFGGLFSSDAARVSVAYMIYGIGMYLLMRSKVNDRFISFFTAFAAVFSTWIITWVMIGHNTKPIAISMFPFILLGLEKLRKRFSLLYAVLLVVAVHILAESTHMQMIFYGICAFGLYLLFELISRLITKREPMGVVRAGLMLALAGGISFMMSADRYLSTFEYTPYSTRGTAPIQQTQEKGKQDQGGGFDYEYSTNWSFSPQEVTTFFVPNFYGFGKLEYTGPEFGDARKLPTYWGQMPFTDAANYMGIFVLGLAILGAIARRRDVFVQFLVVLSFFALFLSFGKNLPILYDLFFHYVPSFNKFRAPSMSLALLQFAVPILAGFGIVQLAKWRENLTPQRKKYATIGVGLAALFLVAGFIFSAAFSDSYIRSVGASAALSQYPENARGVITNFIYDQMISDWYMTGFLALAAAVLIYLYVQKKLSKPLFYGALAVLLVTDLWRVDYRAMEVSQQSWDQEVFQQTDLVSFLKEDKSLYRIADLGAFPSPNVPAYFMLENVHGYHSAKLRVYQDLLDVAGNGGGNYINNPFLWNLMNVKYLVSGQQMGAQPDFVSQQMQAAVYKNPTALPRAFFVNQTQVADRMSILNHLKAGDFDPQQIAFVEKSIPAVDPTNNASAEFRGRTNETMKFDVNATGRNFLFVSEIYYPAGWKAFVDGKETEIYKTNFAFRGIIVPPGKHSVEFRYQSDKFELGKNLSLIANILILGAGAVGIFLARRKPDPALNGAVRHPEDLV